MAERSTNQLDTEKLVFAQLVARSETLADAGAAQLEGGFDKILLANVHLGVVTPGKKSRVGLNVLDQLVHLGR